MSDCFVYMIHGAPTPRRNETLIKIGVSASPQTRLVALRTACPFSLEIGNLWRFADRQSALKVESRAHLAFRAHRLSGEWFTTDPIAVMCDVDVICIAQWARAGLAARDVETLANFAGIDGVDDVLLNLDGDHRWH